MTGVEFGSAEHLRRLRAMERAQRDAAMADAWPLDATVTTTVHSIGGRSEKVTGRVVDHRRGQLVVATDSHGRLMVAPDKVEAR